MKKSLSIFIAAASVVALLSGCVQETASSTSKKVFVGAMDAPTVLDPAATRNVNDLALLTQVMPTLLTIEPNTGAFTPDLAESADYTSGFEYTVTLRPDTVFANGNALTASDVAHSFNRIRTISDPSGPAAVLGAIDTVTVKDDLTLVFKPVIENDSVLPALLAGSAFLIVDEETFPADSVLSNGDVLNTKAWAGPYQLNGYNEGSAANLVPNDKYVGFWGVPENEAIEMRYYADPDQLMFDVSEMLIDIAIVHRKSFAASTFDATEAFAIDFFAGPMVETGFLSLNALDGPFSETKALSPRAAQLTRLAFDGVVDRKDLLRKISGSLFEPADSIVPEAISGLAPEAVKDEGDTSAERSLKKEGVPLPVPIQIAYPESLYGLSVSGYMAVLEEQLEDSDLFDVNLVKLSDEDFASQQSEQTYDALFDYHYPLYADEEAYLYPLIAEAARNGMVAEFATELNEAIAKQAAAVETSRTRNLDQVEQKFAKAAFIAPLMHSGRYVLVRDGIAGAETMLNLSGQLVLADLYRILVE